MSEIDPQRSSYLPTSCNARNDAPGDKFEETTLPNPSTQRVEPVPVQTSRCCPVDGSTVRVRPFRASEKLCPCFDIDADHCRYRASDCCRVRWKARSAAAALAAVICACLMCHCGFSVKDAADWKTIRYVAFARSFGARKLNRQLTRQLATPFA